MKIFTSVIMFGLLVSVNSFATDCTKLADNIKNKAIVDSKDWYSGDSTNINIGRLNLLVQLYRDACGPIPKEAAMELAKKVMRTSDK
jgi:hypothetical protein